MSQSEEKIQFLIVLNELSEGDLNAYIDTMAVGKKLEFDRAKTFALARETEQENFIKYRSAAGDIISITEAGKNKILRIQSGVEISAASLEFPEIKEELGSDVLIVHGSDEEVKKLAAQFIGRLGLNAVILHEMPDMGRIFVENFEEHREIGFALVLLTHDDIGDNPIETIELKPRAQQNVIFELGYLIGKLGWKRVCALYKGKVELPAKHDGIFYVEMDKNGAWEKTLTNDMKDSGLEIE
ncbi:MAG: nucleotide-binding protein [Candidatus Aminicenantes bacterium]|nr:nucleotide-binding protein [Candidatus Aminicenantes bacterium]